MNAYAPDYDIEELNAILDDHIAASALVRQATSRDHKAYIEAHDAEKPSKPRRYSFREEVFHAGRDFLMVLARLKASAFKAATDENALELTNDLNRVLEELVDYHFPQRMRARVQQTRKPARNTQGNALYESLRNKVQDFDRRLAPATLRPPVDPNLTRYTRKEIEDMREKHKEFYKLANEWRVTDHAGPPPVYPADALKMYEELQSDDPYWTNMLNGVRKTIHSMAKLHAKKVAGGGPETEA